MMTVVEKMFTCAGGSKRRCVGMLALVAIAASGLIVAAGDGPEAASETAATASVENTHQRLGVTDPGWQPPAAPRMVIAPPLDPGQAREIAGRWGVQLISLTLSAADYMMDLRFRVLDADKAALFFDHRIKPYVLAERSGAKLPVPMATKVGALRPTNRGKNIKDGKNYYMMFANPDRHVQRGDKVTLVIGDFRVEHLRVN